MPLLPIALGAAIATPGVWMVPNEPLVETEASTDGEADAIGADMTPVKTSASDKKTAVKNFFIGTPGFEVYGVARVAVLCKS
jgi:hypothetical protein